MAYNKAKYSKNITEDLEKFKNKREDRKQAKSDISKSDQFENLIKKKKQNLILDPEEVSLKQ